MDERLIGSSSPLDNNNLPRSYPGIPVDPRGISPQHPVHDTRGLSRPGSAQGSSQWRDNTASFSIIDGRDTTTRYNRSSSTNNINMGSEKYRLKWSKYHDNILNAFHSLLETEALSDVTLFCEGQTFKAHRLVLAANSTHFESLFNSAPVNPNQFNQLFVILDGTRADDLQLLLQYMYRGETYLHHDRINSVLRTAEALQVKGLSEGPRDFGIPEKSSHGNTGGSGSGGGASGGPSTSGVGGGGNNSSASNARVLSSPGHESSPLRSTVGIMGTRPLLKSREHHHQRGGHHPVNDPPQRNSDLHNRDLDGSPPSSHHHLLSRGGSDSSRSHHRALSPPNSDHGNFAYPPPRGGEGFGMYGRAFSSNAGIAAFNRDYSPSSSTRDRSPPPDRVRSYGSASSLPITTKEERDDNYEGGGGRHSTSRTGSLGHASHHDRGTPISDKASDRHTPASHHGGGVDRERDRDYDQRSSRNSPPSPMATPTNSLGRTTPASERAFPSDSTSDLARVAHSSTLKERIRRLSDSAAPTLAGAGDLDPDRKYQDFRREADVSRTRSPAPRDAREEEELTNTLTQRAAVLNMLNSANHERDRFLPVTAGAHLGGINAATMGLTGSASDYMRLAMPVRDPDNGDNSISGSGTKLRCPFCERTYGYETNLRAHIRQRHQGIRVSCPYCPRTFTRNNTVRRHVAREHRHIGGRLPTKFGSTRVMPDPIRIGQVAAAASLAQEADRIQRAAGLQATTSPRADGQALNDNIAAVGNNGGPSPPPSGQPGPNITASSSVSQNTTAP